MTSDDEAASGSGDPSARRSGGWAARRPGESATRRTVMIGMVAVLAVAGAAWWWAGGPDRQGVAGVLGQPNCPTLVPQPPPPRDGLADHIVPIMPAFPVGPVAVTVCRYPGMNSTDSAEARGAILDAARTAEVAGWLDAATIAGTATPRVTGSGSGTAAGAGSGSGTAAGTCTGPDDGSRLVLTFAYPKGPPVQVIIRTSGCPATSNGVRQEVSPRDVVARIADLVPIA